MTSKFVGLALNNDEEWVSEVVGEVPPLVVVGIDEAGRGPLAGPVTAAAVCLSVDFPRSTCQDSKQLSATKREKIYDEICDAALCSAIVSLGPRIIEEVNIREATRMAMCRSYELVCEKLQKHRVKLRPCALIDGNFDSGSAFAEEPVVKGDQKIAAISAASILAKVYRDRCMQDLDQQFPGYGFSSHKGYPTSAHRESIARLGPSLVHRRTFAGVREYV